MIILNKEQIGARLDPVRAATAIEAAYRAASAGDVQLPPVGHLVFDDAGGDCHIKYGHRSGDAYFVVKVATGFPSNAADPSKASVPVNNGVSLVLSATTGEVQAVLHDEMLLTDIRTGIGGAIATRALSRSNATRLLIVGTGVQADHQIDAHRALLTQDLDISIWGRSADRAAGVATRHRDVTVVSDLGPACAVADIIVTITAAQEPIIEQNWIGAGTHITAVGADAPGKHELDPGLLARADVVVVDSEPQCRHHGECSAIDTDHAVVELGDVLAGTVPGRRSDAEVTIADLTGIAAQDIAIAGIVLETSE